MMIALGRAYWRDAQTVLAVHHQDVFKQCAGCKALLQIAVSWPCEAATNARRLLHVESGEPMRSHESIRDTCVETHDGFHIAIEASGDRNRRRCPDWVTPDLQVTASRLLRDHLGKDDECPKCHVVAPCPVARLCETVLAVTAPSAE